MPRRANVDPRTEWKVSLDATIAARVEAIIFDHLSGKPAYGKRSALIERLLVLWLDGGDAALLDERKRVLCS